MCRLQGQTVCVALYCPSPHTRQELPGLPGSQTGSCPIELNRERDLVLLCVTVYPSKQQQRVLVPKSLQRSQSLGNKLGKVSIGAPYCCLKTLNKYAKSVSFVGHATLPLLLLAPRDENARHRRGLQRGLVDLVTRRPLARLGAHPVFAAHYKGGVCVLRALVLHPCNLSSRTSMMRLLCRKQHCY